MWDISDVHSDIKEHFGVVGSSLSRTIRGRGAYQLTWGSITERTSLLPESMLPSFRHSTGSLNEKYYHESGEGSDDPEVPDKAHSINT